MRQQPPDCLSAPGQTASRSQVRYLQALMHLSTILTESMPSSTNATFSHGICTPLASYAYTTCATCLPTLYCTVIQYTDACLSFFPASPPSEPSVAICRGKISADSCLKLSYHSLPSTDSIVHTSFYMLPCTEPNTMLCSFCNSSCCLIYRTIAWIKDNESKPVICRLMPWLIFDNSRLWSVQGYILYCYLDKHVIFSWVNQFCFWKPASVFFPMTVLYHKKTFGGKMLCMLISFTFTIKFQASFSICTQVSVASSRKRVRFCMFNAYARSASPHHQQVSIDGLCTRYPQ